MKYFYENITLKNNTESGHLSCEKQYKKQYNTFLVNAWGRSHTPYFKAFETFLTPLLLVQAWGAAHVLMAWPLQSGRYVRLTEFLKIYFPQKMI